MNTFSSSEAIKFGWSKAKDHISLLIGVILVAALVNFICTTIVGMVAGENGPLLFIGNLLSLAVQLILDMGTLKIALKLHDGQPAKIADLFTNYQMLFKFFAAMVLMGLSVTVGLILFIIPGIILALRFSQTCYLIVDHGHGPIQAMKTSWAITSGSTWELLGFCILLIIINVLGFIALIIGLLVTLPLSIMASAYVYRKLHNQSLPVIVDSSAPAAAAVV